MRLAKLPALLVSLCGAPGAASAAEAHSPRASARCKYFYIDRFDAWLLGPSFRWDERRMGCVGTSVHRKDESACLEFKAF
jgi:hypothetical protein